ncbi:hypothetical protein E2C01_023913 [Portunus trituberculatus]|uniref:Uncharacterized protein n=1 Tax=Portunus trituberculatus TaxID=210409 RepID=A0A5B7EBB8_PORTR|nr:hypothetical protein [Portunus trituberculatus]
MKIRTVANQITSSECPQAANLQTRSDLPSLSSHDTRRRRLVSEGRDIATGKMTQRGTSHILAERNRKTLKLCIL